jgi:hypothetical protein
MSVHAFGQANEGVGPQQPQQTTLSMREAAKWITTAFAAVGAALVASLQLSELGNLDPDDPNLWMAGIGFGVAMVFVGVAIFQSTKVLFSPYITFADLAEAHSLAVQEAGRRRKDPQARLRPWRFNVLLEAIDRDKPDLYGTVARDLGELGDKHAKALQVLMTHEAGGVLVDRQGRPLDDEGTKDTLASARLTLEAVERTVGYANNYSTRRNLDRLLSYMKRAGSVALIGLIVFVWSVNRPKPAEVVWPIPMVVTLNAHGKRLYAAKLGPGCNADAVAAMAVAGDLQEPEVVTEAGDGCRSISMNVTDDVGLALPQPSQPPNLPPDGATLR